MAPPSHQRQKIPNLLQSPTTDPAQAQQSTLCLGAQPVFHGFPEFRSNVLYCPKQIFTVLHPHCSVKCIRLVDFMIRHTLGYVDEAGEPIHEQHQFTYNYLEQHGRVGHSSMRPAIKEATEKRFIRCVQKSRMKSKGQSAQTGIYELRWDENRYTDNPDEFQGFYLKPGYIDQSGQHRMARKNIPNVFFDYLVKHECRSVIRVTGTLLWYSINWGKGGERREPVRKSLRDLARLTNIDRSNVARALKHATRRGYIERVERGVFDLSTKQQSKTTAYGIRWTKTYTYSHEGLAIEVPASDEHSKNAPRLEIANDPKTHHATIQKRTTDGQSQRSKNAPRNAPKTHHQKRSKNAPQKTIKKRITKTSILNNTTAKLPTEPSQLVDVVLIDKSIKALRQQGFSEKIALEIAQYHSTEVIRHQIQIFPKRRANTNPLGLLRKSIEENWEDPETKLRTSVVSTGVQFVAHFYAGFHGNEGKPTAEPADHETKAAEQYIQRLLSISPDKKQVPIWGRSFGQMVRYHQRELKKQLPSFLLALRFYGDRFLVILSEERKATQKADHEKALAKHAHRFAKAYCDYLRIEETRIHKLAPQAYRTFEQERHRTWKSIKRNKTLEHLDALREKFHSEESRLEALAHFFLLHEPRILQFWEWDEKRNPEPFNNRD